MSDSFKAPGEAKDSGADGSARRAVERAARESRGRLIAFLAARSHDVAAAEDALAQAFMTALEKWPQTGVPERPEAWLLTAARHRLIDGARHAHVQADALPTLIGLADEAAPAGDDGPDFPDERLKLLFVCAHPAIDIAARTPLMLQVVLGLDAARIASAFLVQPAAMGQRLSRAKAKIRDARIGFSVPEPIELPERLQAVLEAIYAAYGSGWDDIAGADERRKGLAVEALELGGLLFHFMPGEPEVSGLLALMLHCEARKPARRNSRGEYVPLSEQDPALWSISLGAQADRHLQMASSEGNVGRFQLEAAIQSVHAERARTGGTDWQAIAQLYGALVRLAPTVGAAVGHAAALDQAQGPAAAWAALEALPQESLLDYQPYWALAGHLLERLGDKQRSREAYLRAVGLSEDPATRAFLMGRSGV